MGLLLLIFIFFPVQAQAAHSGRTFIGLGLAPLPVDELLETIQKINRQGVTILLIEQNVTRAPTISTQCYVLELGRVVLSGDGKVLVADERVKTAYLGL